MTAHARNPSETEPRAQLAALLPEPSRCHISVHLDQHDVSTRIFVGSDGRPEPDRITAVDQAGANQMVEAKNSGGHRRIRIKCEGRP